MEEKLLYRYIFRKDKEIIYEKNTETYGRFK